MRSIVDGRFFRQLILMKRSYRKRILLIEGAIPSTTLLSEKSISAALLKVSGGLQIPIVGTTNLQDTATNIERLAVQLYGFSPSRIHSQNLSDPGTRQFYELSIETELRQATGIGPYISSRITQILRGS